jgi:hypothetical protein
MLTKPFAAPQDDSYLARLCQVVPQAAGTNQVMPTIKGVTTPGICLCVDRIQPPTPFIPSPYSQPIYERSFRWTP